MPLKYRALKSLISDANNEDILKINDLIQRELRNRSRVVTVALRKQYYAFPTLSDLGLDVLNEVNAVVIEKYINTKYKRLTAAQRENLILALINNLEEVDESESAKELSKEEQNYLDKIYNSDMGIDENKYEKLLNLLQGDVLNKYYDEYNNSEYLAPIIQKLNQKGIKTPQVMVYSFNLPLGKSYILSYDNKYGEYPIIVDQ